MSLNACSIDTSSVNALCGSRRARILANLIPVLHPPAPVTQPIGGNPRVLRDTFRPDFNLYGETPLRFEQSDWTVSATLLGETGVETQRADANQHDLVTITNLTLDSAEPSITVSIQNLIFR